MDTVPETDNDLNFFTNARRISSPPILEDPLPSSSGAVSEDLYTRNLPKSTSVPHLKPYLNVQGLVSPSHDFKKLQKQAQKIDESGQKPLTFNKIMADFDRTTKEKLDSPSRRQSTATTIELVPERRKSISSKNPIGRLSMPASVPPSPLRKALVIKKKSNKAALGGQVVKNATWSAFTLFCLLYLLWWRSERLTIGYCDTASDRNGVMSKQSDLSKSLRMEQAMSFLPDAVTQQLRPSCMPCPTHGHCDQGELISCDRDYLQSPHPMTAILGKLLPLPDRCVPDTERLIRIAEIASAADQRLRQEPGRVICKGPLGRPTKPGQHVVIADEARRFGMRTDQLREELASSRNVSDELLFQDL